jgi:hypothetical protein
LGEKDGSCPYCGRLRRHPVRRHPRAWKTLPTYDLNYLRLLAGTVDVEPPQPKDAAILGNA